jgi:hypothetical protein
MKEILENPYYAAVIVFASQFAFIYLRTLNVIYTVEKKILKAVLSGIGIGILTLTSFSIGIDSFRGGQVLPVLAFLLGGAIGTVWGIMQNIKNEKK